jgi:hypothetical protein
MITDIYGEVTNLQDIREINRRLCLPADARDIRLDEPGTAEKRPGRKVHGVAVHLQYDLPRTRAHRGRTRYEVPNAWRTARELSNCPKVQSP